MILPLLMVGREVALGTGNHGLTSSREHDSLDANPRVNAERLIVLEMGRQELIAGLLQQDRPGSSPGSLRGPNPEGMQEL